MSPIDLTERRIRKLVEQGPDAGYGSRRNSITGGLWVPGEDSIEEQVDAAIRAYKARVYFASHGPSDCQPLPLSYNEREEIKLRGGLSYIVALYARSLAARDYLLDGHPDFDTYASGLLAIPNLKRLFLWTEPALATRYPPCLLPGLDGSGYWTPTNQNLRKLGAVGRKRLSKQHKDGHAYRKPRTVHSASR